MAARCEHIPLYIQQMKFSASVPTKQKICKDLCQFAHSVDRYESSLVLGMDYSIGVIHKESFMTLKTDILVLSLPKTQQFSIPRFPGWRAGA